MTKKHFQLLADALKDSVISTSGIDTQEYVQVQWEHCVERIAQACKESNPRFDRDRFFRACGYQ